MHLGLQNVGWFGSHADPQWAQEMISFSEGGDGLAVKGTGCILAQIKGSGRTCCSAAVDGMASGCCLLQWGGPWATQPPLVTLLLLWHCLLPSCGYPSKENQKNYTDFMVSSLPLFSCARLEASLISDLNCIDWNRAATVVIHFWIRSPLQERIFCKHSCPTGAGWDCWFPLILSIFCMHNYGS